MGLSVQKVKQSRRFQQVVDEIERAILAGEIQAGEFLPPELELKEMFGTGRGTVREALRVLEEKGLIAIRAGAGGGAVVIEADPAKLTEQLSILVQSRSIEAGHLKEFREAVEPVAASLAARRVTQEGADRLEHAFAQAESGFRDNAAHRFIKGDVAVHVAIAELTGNPLLTAVLKMVHEQVMGDYRAYFKGATTLNDNLEDLRGLVDAVIGGNAVDAERRAMNHVRKFHGGPGAAKGVEA